MAGFNEILVGRFARALQKLTAIKGSVPTPSLATEIIPVFTWNLDDASERALHGWSLFGVGASQAGVAAQRTAMELRNPSGSNTICVITKISISVGVADGIVVSMGPLITDLAIITPGMMDVRIRGTAGTGQFPSQCVFSAGNNVGDLGGVIARENVVGAASTQEFIVSRDQNIPLLPGDGIRFNTVGLNNAMNIGLFYRERFLEDSERSV